MSVAKRNTDEPLVEASIAGCVVKRDELHGILDKYGGSSEVGHATTGVKADGALRTLSRPCGRHFSVTGESQEHIRENAQGGMTIKAIIGCFWQSDQFIVVMKSFERRKEYCLNQVRTVARRDWQ